MLLESAEMLPSIFNFLEQHTEGNLASIKIHNAICLLKI